MRPRVTLALSDCTIKDLTDVAHIMMMRSGEVTAMMMGAARAWAARKVMMTTKARRAKTEARATRGLQEGGNSRKANQQRTNGKGKGKAEDQPRA